MNFPSTADDSNRRESELIIDESIHLRPETPQGNINNRLIDTASRIFSSLTQLKNSPHYHDIQKLREYLLGELTRFMQQTQDLGYNKEVVFIGQYALCATLDETINNTNWGGKASWEKCCLLQTLHENTNADEHFFVILDKLCQKPALFIDTIELMYICMSLGFEGKFRHHPLEKQRLLQTIHDTYQIIRFQRGEFDKTLTPLPAKASTQKETHKKYRSFPLWTILFFSCLMILSLYFGFNYLLTISANQTSQQLQMIENGAIK